ncbi:uncharacterized protein LOC123526886 [Mercenaria mercenaria]|uniref:uncharacterized protein LOC123526886 n=1 Tax=Mercenaria mercenaria TaxID=6596 RepID=UPI00234E8F0E|nr:uncharacterized protein LOC123526886 [Mercenaria mercenaria]
MLVVGASRAFENINSMCCSKSPFCIIYTIVAYALVEASQKHKRIFLLSPPLTIHREQTLRDRANGLIKPEVTKSGPATLLSAEEEQTICDHVKKIVLFGIFNIDETGITPEHTPPNVVGPKGMTIPAIFSDHSGTTTVNACCSATGQPVPPYFVFKGKRFSEELIKGALPGTGAYMPLQKCCYCNKYPSKKSKQPRRVIGAGNSLKTIKALTKNENVTEKSFLCDRCRRSLTTTNYNPAESISVKSPKLVRLDIPSTSYSHKVCVVCKKKGDERNRLVVLKSKAITQAFVQRDLHIPDTSRCCPLHLDTHNFFTAEALTMLVATKSFSMFSRTDIADLLQNSRNLFISSSKVNFDIPSSMTDDSYFALTGLNKNDFQDLLLSINLYNTEVRSARTCLAVFLMKLRTGVSNRVLASLFNLSRAQVQGIINAAADSLLRYFVPVNLGFNHISHSDFVERHTTPLAKEIFTSDPSQAVLVLDGTYIYIQKSQSYEFQRKSYSMHKSRCLVKPMVVVGTDGYFLSVLGPYYANGRNNDASITEHLMRTNLESINQWLKTGDVFIVDRGFRDCVSFLEDNGYSVKMPFYLAKGAKQHTTEEANLSRLVTKVRWVVESANGRIKQWRFFDKVVPNVLLLRIGDFTRIVCAIMNKYYCPLASFSRNTEELARQMLERSQQSNRVLQYLQSNNLLNKRSCFAKVDASSLSFLSEFPKLTPDNLRDITMGVYQIEQAPSYTQEHRTSEGDYELFFHKENPYLIKIQMQSRHISSHQHTLWIEYNTGSDQPPISGWYCGCKVGARTVGCCAHVASVLWFLGIDRHSSTPDLGPQVASDALLDAAEIPLSDDQESDDCDCNTEE